MYGNKSKIVELPLSCNLIGFEVYDIQEIDLTFVYEDGKFNKRFVNSMEFSEVENIIKKDLGIGDNIEYHDEGGRKICTFEQVDKLKTIKMINCNRYMRKEICRFFNMELKLVIGKNKYICTFSCFSGWNKFGLISHIGKMFGLEKGYIIFSVKEYLDTCKSINYYKDLARISGIYENDLKSLLRDRCLMINDRKSADLKQY
jgi:hypothetical protein